MQPARTQILIRIAFDKICFRLKISLQTYTISYSLGFTDNFKEEKLNFSDLNI